jgi:transcriptional regulator with XRE-family HTH domain
MYDADPDQAAARRFVTDVMRVTGWSASRLAKEAGVVHTTLTRFLHGKDVHHTLSARTLGKIRKAAARVIPVEHVEALWLLAQRPPPPQRRPPPIP